MKRENYETALAALPYGKRLPGAVYLLDLQDKRVPSFLRTMTAELRVKLSIGPEFNVLKFSLTDPRISFLSYPDFRAVAHPELKTAFVVNLVTGKVRQDDYTARANPPILHRKDAFIPDDDADYQTFRRLTLAEEKAGLLDEVARIGFRDNWSAQLLSKGYRIAGHTLRKTGESKAVKEKKGPVIVRHRTALVRSEPSRPLKLLLESKQLKPGESFFDYGCGHGRDVEVVAALGHTSGGWDPVHAPKSPRIEADVVGLNYVLNVIENPAERIDTLHSAWALARKLLVVSTLIAGDEEYSDVVTHGDGLLTKRSTFQKYFEQGELHALLEESLQAEAVPVALGVFFVFRSPSDLHDYLALRSKRYIDWESISRRLGVTRALSKKDVYEENRELLDSFWNRSIELGRIPKDDEFDRIEDIRKACGSVPRALQTLVERFGQDAFEKARARRREDLVVYAASAQLRKRIPFTQLSPRLQVDIRSLFGSNTNLEKQAQELLFSTGDQDEMELALGQIKSGEIDPMEGHLTFHRDALDEMPSIFRAYVACGARLFGDPKTADLIKIHLHSKKLTLSHYDDFLGKDFPELRLRIKIDLRKLFVTVFESPPGPERQVLLFKERFLPTAHAARARAEGISARLRKLGVTEQTAGYGPTRSKFDEWRKVVGLDALIRGGGDLAASVPLPTLQKREFSGPY